MTYAVAQEYQQELQTCAMAGDQSIFEKSEEDQESQDSSKNENDLENNNINIIKDDFKEIELELSKLKFNEMQLALANTAESDAKASEYCQERQVAMITDVAKEGSDPGLDSEIEGIREDSE